MVIATNKIATVMVLGLFLDNMKRYLIIGLIVILGIGLFVLGYFLRKDKTPEPVNNGGQNPPSVSTSTPVVTPGKNSKLKLESLGFSVKGFFADKDGGVIFVQPSGHINSLKDGKNTLISETQILNITQASFSYDGKKVLMGFGGRGNPQFSVYDIEKKSWQPLVAGVTAAEWNPNDSRIVYALKKEGYTSLSVLDFGVSKPSAKEITRLHVEDLVVGWMGKDEVAFWNKGSSKVDSSAWKINTTSKKLTSLFSNRTSLDLKVDDKGGNILATSDRNGAFTLSIFGKQGEILKELAVRTPVDKCDFDIEQNLIKAASTKTKDKIAETTWLYCGAPKNFDVITGKLLLEDYAKKQVFSLDNFFKFSVPAGSFSSIYEGPEDLDASQVRVIGNKFYFVNRYDEKLYSIALE